jgi:hypothetical protein
VRISTTGWEEEIVVVPIVEQEEKEPAETEPVSADWPFQLLSGQAREEQVESTPCKAILF